MKRCDFEVRDVLLIKGLVYSFITIKHIKVKSPVSQGFIIFLCILILMTDSSKLRTNLGSKILYLLSSKKKRKYTIIKSERQNES